MFLLFSGIPPFFFSSLFNCQHELILSWLADNPRLIAEDLASFTRIALLRIGFSEPSLQRRSQIRLYPAGSESARQSHRETGWVRDSLKICPVSDEIAVHLRIQT